MSPEIFNRRQLTAQQWDERRQDNSDRRRLVCQHLSDSLRLLTLEHMLGVKYMCSSSFVWCRAHYYKYHKYTG